MEIIELKSTITEKKSHWTGSISRMDMTEDRISDIKVRTINASSLNNRVNRLKKFSTVNGGFE